MQLDAVCIAAAHGGNNLAGLDFLIFLYQKRVVVGIGGNGVVIVADQNQLTVAADFFANVDDGTGCGGADLLALCACNIYAFTGCAVIALDNGG